MDGKSLCLALFLTQAVPLGVAVAAQPITTQTQADVPAAAESKPQTTEEFVAGLKFQKGKIEVGDNLATFDLPDTFVFLDGKDAEAVLEAWGNPPRTTPPLGLLMPAGVSPFDPQAWAVIVQYEADGYVSDEDAERIDYTSMLKDMQQDMREANPERIKQGFEPIELVGWATPPHYDAEGKKLYWAKELRFGDAKEHTLNYNIRVLGRKGVLVLNFIAGMQQLPLIEKNLPSVLAMTEFNPGNRYMDFNPELDKVAAYGLGALVAGKLAAKVGLLASMLVLLKKLWLLPVLAFGWLSRLLKRNKQPAVPPQG